MNVKVMVATHKKYPMPENSNLYIPVLVGAVKNYSDDINYQRDDVGDNISTKNPNYNEMTAAYWAWKNLNGVDAVGLVHYRRFMSNGKVRKPLNEKQIEEKLVAADVILPRKRKYYIETIYSHYVHAHKSEPLDKLRELIRKNYPNYLKSFDDVLSSRSAHMFNMFVMKKEYFDSYAKFLFSVLGDLEEQLDISNYSVQEARVYGYLSEFLMDTWIKKNDVSYAEVNWYQIGSKHMVKKIFFFVCRKFGLTIGGTHF